MKRKILFITIVPPFPDDQGNRVVTRNYMEFFIGLGYDLDVILQAGYDGKRAQEYFGEQVTFYRTYGPKSAERERLKNEKEMYKERLSQEIKKVTDDHIKCILEEMYCAANHYHPFSFISDETVEQTEKCIQKNDYAYIVCNYIYSLRPVAELRTRYKLPKVITITHDAISRLDEQALYYGIDTGERACSQNMEAGCLDHSDVVCAISKYEKEYFQKIGVKSDCILIEYDGLEHVEKMGLMDVCRSDHPDLQICFFGSGNPLNEKGILEFLEKSWPQVTSKHPDVRLLVMGNICEKIKKGYPNVELLGKVSETVLFKNMAKSFLAVNPVYLGTGLKIKSVEMICAGLPFVSFPCGVEGLEELDKKAFMTASDWDGFAHQINMIIEDADLWKNLCHGAKQAGKERFSKRVVYQELEAYLDVR